MAEIDWTPFWVAMGYMFAMLSLGSLVAISGAFIHGKPSAALATFACLLASTAICGICFSVAAS